MRQNNWDNCVIKSRSLGNDAMVRRNKRDECVSYPVLYATKRRNKRDECVTSRSFSLDETKQARQMSNISRSFKDLIKQHKRDYDVRMLLSMINLRATWLQISGHITLVSGDLTVNQAKYLKLFTTRLNKLVSERLCVETTDNRL